MPDIGLVRAEIERMRYQVQRQRGEIRQLQRAGISTTLAEALLDRMLNKIDDLCAERERLKGEQQHRFDEEQSPSPFLNQSDLQPAQPALATRKVSDVLNWSQ